MMPCCHLCYEKYLEHDGSMDQAAYDAAKAKTVENTLRRNPASRIKEQIEARKVCTCRCHTKGLNILH